MLRTAANAAKACRPRAFSLGSPLRPANSMIQWLLDLIFSRGHDVAELARRLDMPRDRITGVKREYREFPIRKRNGKTRMTL